MKDKTIDQGAVDHRNNSFVNQTYLKIWSHTSSASGSYGKQPSSPAGSQTKSWWILKLLKFSTNCIIRTFTELNIHSGRFFW